MLGTPEGQKAPMLERFALFWVSLLLRAWPREFRSRLAAEMQRTFHERWSATRRNGLIPATRLLARTTIDLLTSAAAERLHPTFASPNSRSSRTTGLPLMDWLGQDLRFALRSLLRRPGFAAVAVVTIALGVGANVAIFSVVNGVLLRPLPWPDQDRLVTIATLSQQAPGRPRAISRPDLLDIEATQAFDAVVGYSGGGMVLTGLGEAEAVTPTRVTSGLLRVFGLAPFLGRDLTLDDTVEGSHLVVVLSHAFWLDRLGGSRDVLGTTITLASRPHRIVGVAPAGFEYPAGTDMWRPYANDPVGCARGCEVFAGIGRLSAGTSLDAAASEVDAVAKQLQTTFPETNFEKGFHLETLEESTVGDVREGIWMLLGAVGLVLLIACANVANLLLARAQARTGEVAVRTALGASSRRLVAQVLLESQVLALLGGAAGLLLAFGATSLLRSLAEGVIPRIEEVGVDRTVLLFSLGVTVLVGVLFGLAPALRASRSSPVTGLRSSARGGAGTRVDARSRGLMLTAEVALSLVLLAGAGLLLKSFALLYTIDPGYETRNIDRFSIVLPAVSYPDLASIVSFYETLEERIAAEPGVEAVGSAFGPVLGRNSISGDVRVEGRPEPALGESTTGRLIPMTPGYLEVMRIPVLRGRAILPSDDGAAVPVALVNETFVRQHFPGEDPLGQRVRVSANFGYGDPTWTIVGVVPDIKSRSLREDPPAEVYVPHALFGPGSLTVSVRSAAGAPPVLPRVREIVKALDSNLPLQSVETVAEAVARQVAPMRFFLSLVGLFAMLALVLAATGLYGVATFLASQRRREVGIRLAMGASRRTVVAQMLGQGLRPALWGVVLGLAGAWAAGRSLETLLFRVEATDPTVFGGVAVLLLAVVLLAVLIPARAASRVDPVEALRAE